MLNSKKILSLLISKGKVITFLIIFLCAMYFTLNTVKAQEISLSISPPLLEVTIAPKKEYRHVFTITNSGGSAILKPKIVYFEPTGDLGQVQTTDLEAPDWVRYSKEDIVLNTNEKRDFAILITPPENLEESDHFLTLLLTTDTPSDLNIGQNTSLYQAEIGANILITISNDGKPKKEAVISNFSAPKYVDSIFGKIIFDVSIKNIGSSYIKPLGSIKTNNNDFLKLAEVNVLPNHMRTIPCVKDSEISNCTIKNPPMFGKLIATLEFTVDEEPKVYKQQAVTYLFPFYLSGLISMVLILLTRLKTKIIFKIWRKRK